MQWDKKRMSVVVGCMLAGIEGKYFEESKCVGREKQERRRVGD